MTSYRRKTDGAQVADTEALDASGAMRDGYFLRTSTIMMDSDGIRRVGSVVLNDAEYQPTDADEQKIAQIERQNARLSDAWRNPPNAIADIVASATVVPAAQVSSSASDHGAGHMDTVYDRHDRRLEDAWKTA